MHPFLNQPWRSGSSATLHLNLHRECFAQIAARTKRLPSVSRITARHRNAIDGFNAIAINAPVHTVQTDLSDAQLLTIKEDYLNCASRRLINW